jgi:hypothetical protein
VKHEQQIDADRGSADHSLFEAIEALRQRLGALEEQLRARKNPS